MRFPTLPVEITVKGPVVVFIGHCPCGDEPCGGASLTIPIGPVGEQPIGVQHVANQKVTLTDSQQVKLGPVTAVDKRGNPASLAGPVAYTGSDASLITVKDAGDGTAEVVAVGALGNAQVSVTDGSATAVLDVEVIAGAEAGLSVAVGQPEEQPAA